MLRYGDNLKERARDLRGKMTDAEQKLWARLRRKQFSGVQFYRQKPVGPYILDFYAPKARLVVEVDGSQHKEEIHREKDRERSKFLKGRGLEVLRFNNLQVLLETDAVVEVIFRFLEKRLGDTKGKK
ncbi:MAG: DUF559 domain-containing protein [Pseudomonadota bacterium]